MQKCSSEEFCSGAECGRTTKEAKLLRDQHHIHGGLGFGLSTGKNQKTYEFGIRAVIFYLFISVGIGYDKLKRPLGNVTKICNGTTKSTQTRTVWSFVVCLLNNKYGEKLADQNWPPLATFVIGLTSLDNFCANLAHLSIYCQ